jgi:small-conductance mechanosensitive channel
MKREGKAQLEAMAKQMGFESVEAMQNAAKAHKDTQTANQTELEKEKARADNAEAASKTALETANKRLVDAEIKVFAKDAGFADVTDAVALVDRTSIQVDEQGNVTGAKEAIEALAKAKPHLIGEGKPAGTPGSGGNGGRQDGQGEKGTEFAANLGKKHAEQSKSQAQNQYFK